MVDWLINSEWLEQPLPWSMPSKTLFTPSTKHVPLGSFGDYMYPSSDRLAQSFVNNNVFYMRDYYSQGGMNPIMDKGKRTFHREYVPSGCLGTGGFGQVFCGRRRCDNTQVVIKFLPKSRIINWGTYEGKRVPYEIEVLWRLRGVPGVIRILDHFEERDQFICVMEKVPNSRTLFDFVMESPPLANTELLRHIFREIVRINVALQMHGVWHRDCKPENILYCMDDRSLTFIDFGSAAPAHGDEFREYQGTLEIMVPEWILQRRYNGERACAWTIGVCLYFLLYKQYPFRSKMEIVQGQAHLAVPPSPDRQAYNTMKQCLSGNEFRRPSLSSLQHLSWL